ncbi:hypothetical protein [Halovenus salina]|uniref:DUF8009 domain-containing protein n=1 Tax=Halovenus salina TaxID=1510225 RepID=A0ABD5VZA4_9EURY|nr:hypothetical protein [Halovenus salina]
MPDGDPTSIRSLAVTVEDLVTAMELNQSTPRRAVLRITPPFSGRMRARLHVATATDDGGETLHVDPSVLIEQTAPAYPSAVDTEQALRDDPTETYTVERHHDRHVEAVADWRRAVADAIRETATIHTPAPHEVDVAPLGDLSERESPKSTENIL